MALDAGSVARAAYGQASVIERYYCNFGLAQEKEPALSAAGLRITGRDQSGEARIIELAEHPFFVGTLFVPQVRSSIEAPHPLVTAFVHRAVGRRTQSDNGSVSDDRWVTDDDLLTARRRFSDRIPGFMPPIAYSVARVDGGRLTFAHVNDPSSEHRLPGVVLASVCGYTDRTGTFALSTDEFARAVDALAPAEAATHWDHPNLWSWRQLLEQAGPESTFLAFYVTDLDDPVVDEHDATFRSLLSTGGHRAGRSGDRA